MDRIAVNSTGPDDTCVTVRLTGDIDTAITHRLRHVLVDVIMRRRPARIVVDLRGVTTMDSAAIGTLRAAHQAAHDVHLTLDFHTTARAA